MIYCYYSLGSAKIEDFVFVRLAQRLKDRPLLPRLHSLSYPISAEIFLFITPSLRRVNIFGSTGRNKIPFLSALLETAPLLEEFSAEAFSEPFLKTLSKFNQLKMMDIGDGKLEYIATLNRVFSCTRLTELRVCLSEFKSDTGFENNFDAPFLRKLTLKGPSASVSSVLTRLGFTPLTALRIEYGDVGEEPLDDQWRAPLNLVATWSGSLEVLELEDGVPYGADEDGLEPSIMDQLLQMTRLKHVKLNFNPILDFDDAYMNKIARAWTSLRSLDIRFFGGAKGPLTTIASLEAFATYCPHLHDLSLRISLQPSNLEPSPRCILSHSLQRLFIQYPIAGDTILIVRHLLALFPCLQYVDGDIGESANSEDCEEGEWKEWEDVQIMIELCQATAEDNKMRQKKRVANIPG
ncbi:hypothetical protein C0995_016066 [Termitomyces sp. Mi166|nr:hypothetical protein C0995_016066 [Termitomyces sp. Mi166\